MGFEYKIKIKLSFEDKEELSKIIPKTKDSFKDELIFEDDGIYICKYKTTDVWKDIEEIKKYIDNRNFNYKIEEL